MTTPAQYVTFTPVDPPGAPVRALLGADPAKFSSEGGWAFVTRPRRSSMTEYGGVEAYTLTVPCMFDGFRDERSVEPDLEMLRSIMRERVGQREEPAVVQVRGAGVPLTHLYWVIQNLEYGDEIRRPDGARTRAAVTVTLLQYIAPDLLVTVKASPAEAAQQRAATTTTTAAGTTAPSSQRTYTVKSGDTLSSIAARQLGAAGKWTQIADLNGIRDPRTLRVGQVLRLP